jgi:hypothetical protein
MAIRFGLLQHVDRGATGARLACGGGAAGKNAKSGLHRNEFHAIERLRSATRW